MPPSSPNEPCSPGGRESGCTSVCVAVSPVIAAVYNLEPVLRVDLASPATVAQLLHRLGLKEDEAMVLVDGRLAPGHRVLGPGEVSAALVPTLSGG